MRQTSTIAAAGMAIGNRKQDFRNWIFRSLLSCTARNKPRPMRIGRQMTVKRKVFFTAKRNAWLLNMS